MLGRRVEDLFAGDLADAHATRFDELSRLWGIIDSEAGFEAVLACARAVVARQTSAGAIIDQAAE